MEIQVYNWEKFERWRGWYIWFWIFFSFMILASIFSDNMVWAVLLFLLLGWYLIFSLGATQKIKLTMSEEWLKIWAKLYPWNEISGYVIEIDEKQQTLKNIIFMIWNNSFIHTMVPDPDSIKEFILRLDDIIPRYSAFNQSFLEKLARKMKL